MKKQTKILHPTDLSPNAEIAFRIAIQFAKQFDASLDILHVAPTFGDNPLRNAFSVSIDEKQFYATLIEEVDEKMLAMQEQENTGSIRIRRIHSRGTSPAAIILDYAIQQDIDLIVMGTHGHRGLKKIILGSTALEVIRRAPCDVLTVNNNTVVREFQDSSRSMLVPVDLSDKSELLLQEAVDIAKKMSYHIDLLHIVESPFVPALGLDASDLYRMLPSRKKQASEHVDKLVAGLGDCGVSINVLVRDGQPSTLINALAKELQSELIVMAPGTTTWFERVPLGSVSEHILSSAPCPVYMLPASQNDSITDDMEKEDLTTT